MQRGNKEKLALDSLHRKMPEAEFLVPKRYDNPMPESPCQGLRIWLQVFNLTDGELNGEPVPVSTQPEVSLYPETRMLLFWLQTLPALPYNV
jgi:hypothetical protein